VEADRFCRFLRDQPDVTPAALAELDREHRVVAAKLAASRSIAGVPYRWMTASARIHTR
jgi:hypothetical protein